MTVKSSAASVAGKQILAQLEARLDNDPESEDRVVAGQLREIAVLRLSGRVAE